MKLIIDKRIRDVEYDYLNQFFDIAKMDLNNELYDAIAGHSDIFYCKINNKIICAPNAPILKPSFIQGNSIVKNGYPKDVSYNACQIGKNIIGSKYTDKKIPVNILTNQGYTKCSIAVTSDNSCITSDIGIYNKLLENNIDVTYIEQDNIYLLDRNGQPEKIGGFIGGASLIFDSKFVLFGDIETLNNKNVILQHLKKHKLQLIDFKGLDVFDYGGGIIE